MTLNNTLADQFCTTNGGFAAPSFSNGLKLKTSVKAGYKACNSDGSCQAPNHNQSAGLKMKTSVKAGFKACNSDGSCSAPNHNQTVIAA